MMNKQIMRICPTLKWAEYEWRDLQRKYPEEWIDAKKHPLTLVHKDGTTYIFRSVAETPRCTLGFRGEIKYV